jgi:hypothetical protein
MKPTHPDKRCRCGKQTWKKAEAAAFARATDKSVRDLPLKVKSKAGQIIVEQSLCGIIFSFPAAVWPDDGAKQRAWIERLTPWWDIGEIGWTPTCQRLRESCVKAINKLFPAEQLLTSPFPTAQPRTSPSEPEGGPKAEAAALRRRDNQTTGDVTRQPNQQKGHEL